MTILTIHDSRYRRRGDEAPMEQVLRMRCFDHVLLCFAGINTDMVFLHFHLCRYETVASGYGIWKLFLAIFAEFSCQFRFRQVVFNTVHWKEPVSNPLYRSRNPSPSHKRILIRSFRLPQNRKSIFVSYGSSAKRKHTMEGRPSIPGAGLYTREPDTLLNGETPASFSMAESLYQTLALR